jgi:hypothetical protein
VVVHPAEQPGADVLVQPQLLVHTLLGLVAHEMCPQLGPPEQCTGHGLELGGGEDALLFVKLLRPSGT